MTLACCRAHILRVFSCLIPLTLFFLHSAAASQRDAQGASRSYEEACQKKNAVAQTANPESSQYLECAKAYRKVYVLDPHNRHASDAIYEEALLYQEMGDKFSNPAHYQTAVKRFHLLVTDYGGSTHCPDALMRIGSIYSKNLGDEKAAQEAYRHLQTHYRSFYDSMRRAHPDIALKPESQDPGNGVSIEPAAGSPVSVQNIRYWSTRDYTRVIIDLDSDAIYKKERLANPERIFFDISNAKLGKGLANRTITVGDDYLKQIRAARNQLNLVRVVLDISQGIDYSVSELRNPFRIVVDLRGSGSRTTPLSTLQVSAPRPDEVSPVPALKPAPAEGKAAKSRGGNTPVAAPPAPESKAQKPADVELRSPSSKGNKPAPASAIPGNESPSKNKTPNSSAKPPALEVTGTVAARKAAPPTSRGDRTLTRTLGLKINRIVIDPGHGGQDQGTIGAGGLLEKNLVLSLAHMLKTLLEDKLGAEVLLTRDGDTFIPLEERTAFANQHHADLFISIHANSSRIHSVSGVETYYLDFAKTDAEREIAARENATSNKNVRDLEDLIKKIAKADKSAESRELASLIQQTLFSGARKLFPSTLNRGVRSAPFVVLIGAKMPSVLSEVAFISNSRDGKLLAKKENQESIAKALFSGIRGYVNTLGSEIVANQKSKTK